MASKTRVSDDTKLVIAIIRAKLGGSINALRALDVSAERAAGIGNRRRPSEYDNCIAMLNQLHGTLSFLDSGERREGML